MEVKLVEADVIKLKAGCKYIVLIPLSVDDRELVSLRKAVHNLVGADNAIVGRDVGIKIYEVQSSIVEPLEAV